MGQSLLEDDSEIKPYEIKPPYPQQSHQTRAMAHTLLTPVSGSHRSKQYLYNFVYIYIIKFVYLYYGHDKNMLDLGLDLLCRDQENKL